MSEATIYEAMESEALESSEGESEALEGEAGPEALESEAAEALWWGRPDDDARRRRQRQIMLARQRAQLRRPPPPAPAPQRAVRAVPSTGPAVTAIRSDVRSLALDTNIELNRLRRALDKANRVAYRNAWAAEASVAASQVLDSFENGLKPHDWARTLIRAVPTFALDPGPRQRDLQGILFDPRVAGGAIIAGIWAFGHFRNQSQGVGAIQFPESFTVGGGNTGSIAAFAVDRNGNPRSDVTISYKSQDESIVTITDQTKGTFKVDKNATSGQTAYIVVTASVAGTVVKTEYVSVTVQ